ncbi:MAG TPA: fumarylacetoacetate hydrolase family protein [Stellaceae bacterium]|nr:fumarylacetoacetate hydrolase family protein [Stellaceae bacterium]
MSEAHGFDREPLAADAAASYLAELWRSGRQVTALPPELRPSSLEEGYDIQDRLVAALGERVVGWKLGVGSRKGKIDSKVGRAIAGRVLASRCVRTGETVRLPDRAPVTVEFEIAYVLARDIPPGDRLGDPLDAIAEIRTTVELVRARFVDRRSVGWPSFAADNAGFEALIVGEVVDPARLADIAPSTQVLVDGHERARALTGDDVTDVETAFTDFVALARERGMMLPKGSIISTGTVSKPFVIEGTAEVSARYLDTAIEFKTEVA